MHINFILLMWNPYPPVKQFIPAVVCVTCTCQVLIRYLISENSQLFYVRCKWFYSSIVILQHGHKCSELSSGIYCRVKLLSTDVSEVRTSTVILQGNISQKTTLNIILAAVRT
jgi:hypothetical protein